jgi:tetratricopeptide (TPR) repeat protein
MPTEDEQKLEMLEASLLLNPKDQHKWFWLGRQQRKMKRLEDARKAYDRALRLDPKFADVHYEVGLLESEEGNEAAAESSFARAIEHNAKHFGAHDELARRREASENWPAAAQHLETMAKGRPEDTATLRRAAHAWIAQKRYPEATAHLEKAVERAPTEAVLRGELGRCYVEQGFWQRAKDCFTGVALEALNTPALLALAKAHRELGELGPAARCFEALLAAEPNHFDALVGFGRTCLLADQLDRARDLFGRALALDSSHAEVHALHGKAAERLGDFEAALKSCNQGVTLDATSAFCHEGAGLALNGLRRYDEAVSAFQRALRYDAERLSSSIGLAEAHERLNQGERAVAALQRALEVAPSDAAVHERLANLLYRLGHTARALVSYEETVKLAPTASSAHRGIGQCAVDLERFDEAVEALRRAVELNAEDVVALRLLGRAEHALKRPKEAAETFERATRVDGTHAPTWHDLGACLIEAKKVSAGLDALERARALDATEPTSRLIAFALMQLSRFEDAVPVFEDLVKIAPDDALLWRDLGRALRALQREEKARDALGHAARLARTEASYSFEHGAVCLVLGEFEKAATALELAHQLAPHDTQAAVALGQAYNGLGRFADAISVLRTALARDPTLVVGQRALGQALASLERLGEARVAYEKAVELKGDDGVIHHELGDVLFRLDDFGNAVLHLKRATLLSPQRTEAIRTLARAQRQLGNTQDALTTYRQLLRHLPEDADAMLELSEVDEALGRDEDALQLLEQAQALRPDTGTRRRIGLLQAKLARDLLATETLGAVLGNDPSEFPSYAVLAACHRRLRNTEAELGALEQAAKLAEKARSPEAFAHYEKWGLTLADASRETPALGALTKALELGSTDPATATRLALLHRAAGTRALENQEPSVAVPHLEHAMKGQVDAELYRLLASAYLESKRTDDAIGTLEKGLLAFPKALELASFLGRTLFALGDYTRAYDAFQRALALKPDAFDELWGGAQTAEALGRRKDALALLVRAQAERPQSPEVAERLGRLYYEESRFRESLTAWQKLLELRPLDADASYRAGLCQRDLGDDRSARVSFQRASTQAPKNAAAHHEFGACHLRLLDFAAAAKALAKAVELDPALHVARELLGPCLAKLGKDADAEAVLGQCLETRFDVELCLERARCLLRLERWLELERAADAILKAAPGHTEALQLRASGLDGQGRNDEALAALRLATSEGKDPAAAEQLRALLVERAELNSAAGDAHAAATAYREALTLAPKELALHLSLSLALRACGQVQLALDATRVGLELHTKSIELWVLRAELLATGSVLEESVEAYQTALELAPRHEVALLGIADVFERRGELELADQALERATQLDAPKVALKRRASVLGRLGKHEELERVSSELRELGALDGDGLRNLAQLQSRLGKHDEAAVSAEKALDVLGDDAESLFLLGVAEHHLGRNERAVAALERLVAHSLEHREGWALLAKALLRSERWERAVAPFERAVSLSPEDVELWQGLTTVFERLGRKNDEIRALRAWVKLAPSPALHRRLGFLLFESKATDAELHLDAAARELKEDGELAARLATLLVMSAEQSVEAGAKEAALAQVRRAVPHAHRDGSLSLRAATLLRELELGEEALTIANRAVELAPSDVSALILQGRLRLETGAPQGALVSFKRAVELKADALPALEGMGRACLAQAKYEDAENALRRATTIAPDDAALWSLLTAALDAKGARPEACESQRQVVRLRRGDVSEELRLAQLLMLAERFAESVDVLLPLWKTGGSRSDVALALATSLVEVDRMQDAVNVVTASFAAERSDQSNDAALSRVQAVALSKLDRADDAIAAYERALELGISEVKAPLADALRRRAAELAGTDAKRSSSLYDRALKLATRDSATLIALARSRRNTGELQVALDSAREALTLEPESLEAQLLLAQLEAALGRHQPAIVAFERVIAAHPESAEAWLGKGLSKAELRSPDAVAALERSVELRPTREGLEGLILLHHAANDELSALVAFDRLAQLGPLPSDRVAELAQLRLAHARARDAQSLLDEALVRDPDDAGLLFEKARASLNLSLPRVAREALEKLLLGHPEHEAANGLLGQALSELGDHAAAALAFEKQVAHTPTPECLERLADSLGRLGDEAKRQEVLARLSRAQHDDKAGLLRIAKTHTEAGRIDDAIAVLERARQLAPDDRALVRTLGRQLLVNAERNRADVERALVVLERAEGLPPDVETLPDLAALYRELGQLAAARRVAETWLELEPRSVQALTRNGELLEQAGETERALGHFEQALEVDRDHLAALRGAGMAFSALNRQQPAAERLLRAVRLDSSNATLNERAISCASAVEDQDKAEQLLRDLSALLPAFASAKLKLAGVLGRRENVAEALDLVDAAIALLPKEVENWVAKAELSFRLGRTKVAIESAERALELAPGRGEALRILGLARAQSGETENALEPLEKAYRESQSPELRERLAGLYAQQGFLLATSASHERAVSPLRRAIELGADDARTRIALGNALAALGQTQGVIEALADRMELTREYLPGWVLLGEAYDRSNQWSRAVDSFDVALELDTESFEALRGRARVAVHQTDREQASRCFERALQVRPDALEVRREAVRWYDSVNEPNAVLRHLEALGAPEHLEADELRRLGILLGQAQRDPEAERVLELAFERGLSDAATLDVLSLVQARRDPKSALAAAARLVELEPSHREGWLRLARAQRAAGDESSAERAYERAIHLNGSKDVLAELAELQSASTQGDKRLETLHRLVESYPDDAEHTAALGIELARNGRQDAVAILERALTLGSTNAEVRLVLHALLLKRAQRAAESGQADKALELAERALHLAPAQVGPGLMIASLHRAARRDDAAIDALRAVLKLDGQSRAALIQLGTIEIERGEFQAAIPRLRRAAELDPTDTEALRVLVDAELGLGRPDAAQQALEKLLERSPTDVPAKRQLIRQLMSAGQYARALEVCQGALAQVPDDVPLRIDLARAYQKSGRIDDALMVLDQVVRAEPDNLVAHRLYVEILREVGATERLVPALQALFRVDRTREPLLGIEQCAQKLRQPELKLWALRELTALAPNDAPAFARLGEALNERGQVEDGIQKLERAIAIDPKTPWIKDALVRVCWTVARQKSAEHDIRSANEHYEKAANHAPTNPTLSYEYAATLQRAKSPRANEVMRSALRSALGNPKAVAALLPQLGAALFDMQDYPSAVEAYHQACQLEPQQLELQRGLISALLHAGKRVEAVEWLRHAVRLAPRDESLLYSLGIQYAMLGRMSDVRDVWNALNPLNPELAQQLLAQSAPRR